MSYSSAYLIHRLQGEIPQSLVYWGMSRRPAEGGVAQPRMKNPPASVLGEASIGDLVFLAVWGPIYEFVIGARVLRIRR